MNISEEIKKGSDSVATMLENILLDRKAIREFVLQNCKDKAKTEKTLGDYGVDTQDEKRVSALFEKQFKKFLEIFRVWATCGGTTHECTIPKDGERYSKIVQCVERSAFRKFASSKNSKSKDDHTLVGKCCIPSSYWTFSDIPKIDDKIICQTLHEINMETLAVALVGASNEIKEKFFHLMNKRASIMLKEDIEFMGPVLQENVDNARDEVLRIIETTQDNAECSDNDK